MFVTCFFMQLLYRKALLCFSARVNDYFSLLVFRVKTELVDHLVKRFQTAECGCRRRGRLGLLLLFFRKT